MLRSGTHHCPPLQRAFLKYGESNFAISVLEELETLEAMLIKEKVEVDGIVYNSMGEAARTLGCVVATVSNRCKSDKFPNYKKV